MNTTSVSDRRVWAARHLQAIPAPIVRMSGDRYDATPVHEGPAPRRALRRLYRGHFIHDDTRDVSVRYHGAYLRMSIVQALALADELPAGAELAERLRTDAAAALREDHGMSWERACALVAGDAR